MIENIHMDLVNSNIQTQVSYENFVVGVYSEVSEEAANFKTIINIIAQRYEKAFYRILDIIVDLTNKAILYFSRKVDKQLSDSIEIGEFAKYDMAIPELTIGVDKDMVVNAKRILMKVVNDTIDTIEVLEGAEKVLENKIKELVKTKKDIIPNLNIILKTYDHSVFESPLFTNTVFGGVLESDGSMFTNKARTAIKTRLCHTSKHNYPMVNKTITTDDVAQAKEVFSGKHMEDLLTALSSIKSKVSNIKKLQKKTTVVKSIITVGKGIGEVVDSKNGIVDSVDAIQNMYRTMHMHKMTMITVIQSMYMVTMEYTMNFRTLCIMILSAYNKHTGATDD